MLLSASCNTLIQQGDGLIDSACSSGGIVNELTEALRHNVVSYEEHLSDVAIIRKTFSLVLLPRAGS